LLNRLLTASWWISGIVLKATRHRWIVSTIISWFFILLLFFQHFPVTFFSRPIEAVWKQCIEHPFFSAPYYLRLAFGWLCLLALIFGSAFGVQLQHGSTYGDRAISVFGLFVFQVASQMPFTRALFVDTSQNQLCFYLFSNSRKHIQWNT
jgi:CNT family concentrative nucleoside transporter